MGEQAMPARFFCVYAKACFVTLWLVRAAYSRWFCLLFCLLFSTFF